MNKTPPFLERKKKQRKTKLFLLRVYVVSLIILAVCFRVLSQGPYAMFRLLALICALMAIPGGFMVIALSTPIKKLKNRRGR